jgi:DNA-binding HxlR family transcriptional regulator
MIAMTNKTYNQYCAIAHALDIVGDRWTLLLIRNLLAGPKRFSDLMKGLPGISTNMLTDRLKMLDDHELTRTRYLPPPAASMVYELTQEGFGLVPALSALARWGARSLGAPQTAQAVVTESVVFMLLGMFWCEVPSPLTLTCNVRVKDAQFDQVFGVRLSPSGVQIDEQPLSEVALNMEIALQPLLVLSSQQVPLQTMIEDDSLTLEGDPRDVAKLVAWGRAVGA